MIREGKLPNVVFSKPPITKRLPKKELEEPKPIIKQVKQPVKQPAKQQQRTQTQLEELVKAKEAYKKLKYGI